jgi:phage-related holin
MKTYKNLQEFINSKPSKELNEQVLNYINKVVNAAEQKELKISLIYKRREVDKLEKIFKNLEKMKVDVPKELTEKLNEVRKEKEDLEKIFKK